MAKNRGTASTVPLSLIFSLEGPQIFGIIGANGGNDEYEYSIRCGNIIRTGS